MTPRRCDSSQLKTIMNDAAVFASWQEKCADLALERRMTKREARCFAAFMRVLCLLEEEGAGDSRTWEALADAIVEVTESGAGE